MSIKLNNIKMTTTKRRNAVFPSVWNDLFEGTMLNSGTNSQFGNTVPAVNIKESDLNFILEFAAPGLSKSDFKINLEEDVLAVSAENKKESGDKEEGKYTRKEFKFSSFNRKFTLPESANKDEITATYFDGILKVTITKKEEEQATPKRMIEVN